MTPHCPNRVTEQVPFPSDLKRDHGAGGCVDGSQAFAGQAAELQASAVGGDDFAAGERVVAAGVEDDDVDAVLHAAEPVDQFAHVGAQALYRKLAT